MEETRKLVHEFADGLPEDMTGFACTAKDGYVYGIMQTRDHLEHDISLMLTGLLKSAYLAGAGEYDKERFGRFASRMKEILVDCIGYAQTDFEENNGQALSGGQ